MHMRGDADGRAPARHNGAGRYATLVELLSDRAWRQPLDTAYIFLKDGEQEQERLTFADLDREARRIATALQACTRPGDRALLIYPPGLGFLKAFFGCLYAGVLAVPVYPPTARRGWPRLHGIAADCAARVVCTLSAQLPDLRRGFAASPQTRGARLLATDAPQGADSDSWRPPDIGADSLAFLQYTSGSTGAPKGVMVSHGNLLHNQALIKRRFEHSERTRFVGWVPLYHDMGLIGNVLQPLYLGIPSVLMSPVSFLVKPVRWLQAISRYRATTSGGPNFAYELCVRRVSDEQMQGVDLSRWELAFNGAEPVCADTLSRFSERFAPWGFREEAFFPCYGLAESTLLVTGTDKASRPTVASFDAVPLQNHRVAPVAGAQAGAITLASSGRAAGMELLIVDPDTHQGCAPAQVGEIWVRGDSVARGYWENAQSTEATFGARLAGSRRGPYLRTGDLGFVRDGELFVTGRLKDLIIIRGRNYYPQDIEVSVQQSHAGFRNGCGAAFSLDTGGEEALVVVHEVRKDAAAKLDAADAQSLVRRAIMADHGLPLHDLVLIRHGTLLKTSSGKIRRAACRQAYLNDDLQVLS
jgi:acyl-CoA synthetase (AMP-forming)/AMP-acid ligase II